MSGASIFKVRRSIKRIGRVIGAFGLLIPAGAAVMLYTAARTGGLALIAFGTFFVLILLLPALAPGSRYQIDSSGVLLKKGLSSRRIAFADFIGARVISETEANAVITEYMTPAVASEVGLDLKGWVKSNRKYGDFLRYCTVPVIQSKKTPGNSLNIVEFRGKTLGEFTILRITSGEELLLSPADPRAFYQSLSLKFRATADLTAPYPNRSEQISTAGDKPIGYRRRFLVVSLSTASVLVAAVVFFLPFRSSDTAQTEQVTAVEEPQIRPVDGATGWIDGSVFRSRLERTTMIPTVKDLEKRKKAMRNALYASYHFEIIDALIDGYYLRFDLNPGAVLRQEVWSSVEEFFFTLEQILLFEEFNEEVTAITVEIEIKEEGMRDTIDHLIADALSKKSSTNKAQ